MEWQNLLDEHNIPYVTRGPNTRRGEISIKCPFCGEDDPSEHLGIVLDRPAWGCHRNQEHRGKAPHRLIQALLGCSLSQARLVVAQYDVPDPDTLDTIINASAVTSEPPKKVEQLTLPDEFTTISYDGPTKRFYWYLLYRGFYRPLKAIERYNLKCCTTGRWKDRLIIPIYQNGELIAWTARALQNPINAPRYLSTGEAVKTALFNEKALSGGNTLFVTEGPFDAMKVDYYGYESGAMATAVFGTSITIDQISILKQVSKRYRQTILLFDNDATETSFNMAEWLPGAVIGVLPEGVKDPGDLSQNQVLALIKQYQLPP